MFDAHPLLAPVLALLPSVGCVGPLALVVPFFADFFARRFFVFKG